MLYGLRGEFVITSPRNGRKIILPNSYTDEGKEAFLQLIFQDDDNIGAELYVGICGATLEKSNSLTDVANEPSSAGGYARLNFTRDSTDWPTVDTVNGIHRARTSQGTFTASGVDFDQPLHRLFLTNVASGTSGLLLAFSAALVTPETIAAGESYNFYYSAYLG